jgi:hypothetical protein
MVPTIALSPNVLHAMGLPTSQYHIYVVGSEECENSIAMSIVKPSKAHWEGTLRETFGGDYEMLCGHTLQATHQIVFVHK